MVKKNVQKLRDRSKDDLEKELIKEGQKLQEMKFDLARGKVKNSAAVRDSKKKIARLLTLIKEKEAVEVNIQNGKG